MKNEEKLKKLALAGEERYYYLRFGKGSEKVPDGFLGVATVCIIPYPSCDGTGYVRGVSFCNPRDQFNKRLGRTIALGRAIKALERGEDSEPVPDKTPAAILKRRDEKRGIFFLSGFNPALSEFEQSLFSKSKNTGE